MEVSCLTGLSDQGREHLSQDNPAAHAYAPRGNCPGRLIAKGHDGVPCLVLVPTRRHRDGALAVDELYLRQGSRQALQVLGGRDLPAVLAWSGMTRAGRQRFRPDGPDGWAGQRLGARE
jgi:hypothetical protein